jgi:hypothetical protein
MINHGWHGMNEEPNCKYCWHKISECPFKRAVYFFVDNPLWIVALVSIVTVVAAVVFYK